jgi:hypothetical protein
MKTFCLIASMFVLIGCTLVVIKGSENDVSDTGKLHGGQLNIQPPGKAAHPAPASEPHPIQNLLHPNDTHH